GVRREIWISLHQGMKSLPSDPNEPTRRSGDHGRRSRSIIDQGHFADNVPLTHGLDEGAADDNVHAPLEQNIHAVALLALEKQHFTGPELQSTKSPTHPL